ncbi:hypothetical protein F9K33_16260 [bacterium]|nr:MAG: hypothetical protein F9K33_16260 [bacterium]
MNTMYKDVKNGKYLALDSNAVVSIFPDSLLRRNWSSDDFYLYSKQVTVHGFPLFSLIHYQYAIGYYLKLVLLSPENEFIASSIVAMRAGEGGASADAHTTFLNDSVFVVTTVYGETDFDSSGRTRIDSVISTFIIRPNGFSQIERKQFEYMR